MGQARRRLERMAAQQPWCVYCGCSALGTSVDHMPPITIFNNRDRPKGMEYLACEACHAGSRPLDLLVGFLSRMYPDAGTSQAQQEVADALQGLRNNYPKLFDELAPSPEQEAEALRGREIFPGTAGALAIGPGIHSYLARFAARVGLALHYELCGEVVPAAGAVLVRVLTNFSLVDGEFPSDFAEMLGAPRTLRQGRKTVEEQFGYASRGLEDNSLSAHIATFRMSFAIQAFVARDRNDLSPPAELGDNVDTTNRLFRPGFLTEHVSTWTRIDDARFGSK